MAAEGGLLPPVIAELRATTGEFKTKMLEARGEMSATAGHAQGTFDKMAGVGQKAFFALGTAAVALGTVALHEADKFEAAHARMETSLKNVGVQYDQVKGKVAAYDSSMEKLGFSNADAENSLSRLILATKDLGRATQDEALAADISRARHIDLQSATDLLTKVEQGRFTVLTRLGIASKEQVAQLHNAREATALLTQLYGGQAQAYAETFAGKLEVLKAKSEDLAKNIGLRLIPIIESLVSGGLAAAQWLERHHAAAIALAVAIGGPLAAAMAAYVIQQAAAFGTSVLNNASMLLLRIQMLGNAVTGAGTAWGSFLSGMAVIGVAAGGIFLLTQRVQENEKAAKQMADSYIKGLGGLNDSTLPQVKQHIEDLKKTVDSFPHFSVLGATIFPTDLHDKGVKANEEMKRLRDAVLQYEDDKKAAVLASAGSIAGAYESLGGNADSLGGSEHALAQSFSDAQDAAKSLKEGLDELIGVHVSSERAAIEYQDKVASLAKGIRDQTAAGWSLKAQMDITTDAGRKTVGQILDTIDAITKQADSMTREGATTEQVNAVMQAHVEQLRQVLAASGFTTAQIDALVQQYHLIPSQIGTTLTADTTQADAALQATILLLEKMGITAEIAGRAVRSSFATNAPTYSAPRSGGLAHNAAGGFIDRPLISWLGEKGRELVLPLTDHRRTMELLAQAGLLGVSGAASGGSSMPMGGGSVVHLNVGGIVVQGAGDPKAAAREIVDEIGKLTYEIPEILGRFAGS